MHSVEDAATLLAHGTKETQSSKRAELVGRAFLQAWPLDGTGAEVLPLATALVGDADPKVSFVADACAGLNQLLSRGTRAGQLLERARTTYQSHHLAADPTCFELRLVMCLFMLRPEDTATIGGRIQDRTDLGDLERARVLIIMGTARAWSGSLHQGEAYLQEARQLAVRLGARAQEAHALAILAKTHGYRGVPSAPLLSRARRAAAEAESLFISRGIAECAVVAAFGDGDEARWLGLLEVLVGSDDGHASGLWLDYLFELATWRRFHGDVDGCMDLLTRPPEVPPGAPAATLYPHWWRWLRQPADPTARAGFREAALALTRPAEWAERARACWLLGDYLLENGDPATGTQLREQAMRTYVDVGAVGMINRMLGIAAPAVAEPVHPVSVTPGRHASASGLRIGAGERPLTHGERVVAQAIGRGLSNREVADQLGVSVKAVEYHLGNIYRKLGIHNRTQLALAHTRVER